MLCKFGVVDSQEREDPVRISSAATVSQECAGSLQIGNCVGVEGTKDGSDRGVSESAIAV